MLDPRVAEQLDELLTLNKSRLLNPGKEWIWSLFVEIVVAITLSLCSIAVDQDELFPLGIDRFVTVIEIHAPRNTDSVVSQPVDESDDSMAHHVEILDIL